MKNPRAKGNRNQLKAIKELESAYWLVGKTERIGRFIKQKDLFGIADLIAIRTCSNVRTEIKLIQVTSNRPHTHKKFTEFAEKYGESYFSIEQWVWKDRKGWKIYVYPLLKNLK